MRELSDQEGHRDARKSALKRGSIFSEAVRDYASKYVKAGDLVLVRGRMKQNSFERNGEKVYTVDLVAEEFSILASKNQKAIEVSAQPKPAKKAARIRK